MPKFIVIALKYVFYVAFIVVVFFYLTTGCKKKKDRKLQQFDSVSWINDKNGCDSSRLTMKDQVLSLKHLMKGLKVNEIETLMGRPDAQELYQKNQRYYIYFIEPGGDCSLNNGEQPLALYIRFSAIGIANEISIKKTGTI